MIIEKTILLIGILLTIAGLFFGIFALFIFRLNSKTKNWPQVNGKIIESQLKEKKEIYAYDTDEFNSTESKSYSLNIKYTYAYNNEQFKNNKLYLTNLNNIFLSTKHLKKINTQLIKNSNTEVYLNPEEPSQAVLFNYIPIKDKILYSAIFSLLGIITIIFRSDISSLFNG